MQSSCVTSSGLCCLRTQVAISRWTSPILRPSVFLSSPSSSHTSLPDTRVLSSHTLSKFHPSLIFFSRLTILSVSASRSPSSIAPSPPRRCSLSQRASSSDNLQIAPVFFRTVPICTLSSSSDPPDADSLPPGAGKRASAARASSSAVRSTVAVSWASLSVPLSEIRMTCSGAATAFFPCAVLNGRRGERAEERKRSRLSSFGSTCTAGEHVGGSTLRSEATVEGGSFAHSCTIP
mmetsp:Transcript_9724/g.23075  ORF Transcript_9724/g.23075 Transcript_9724/m.23075 type:complete len:235 (+) Transcript_9724:265-969(+)